MMTRSEAEALLDLMEERAGGLRAKGILSVTLGPASFTLAPAELEADETEPDPEEGPSDVLHDAWAHGIPSPGAPASLPARKRTPI